MQASIETQKMILGQLFKRIEVGKGYVLKVEINADYEQFCYKGGSGVETGKNPAWFSRPYTQHTAPATAGTIHKI